MARDGSHPTLLYGCYDVDVASSAQRIELLFPPPRWNYPNWVAGATSHRDREVAETRSGLADATSPRKAVLAAGAAAVHPNPRNAASFRPADVGGSLLEARC